MKPDPSLVARIWDWFWAVVWNWKGLVAGLSLASGFILQLLPERGRHRLDQILRREFRRRGLIVLCLLLLLIFVFSSV